MKLPDIWNKSLETFDLFASVTHHAQYVSNLFREQTGGQPYGSLSDTELYQVFSPGVDADILIGVLLTLTVGFGLGSYQQYHRSQECNDTYFLKCLFSEDENLKRLLQRKKWNTSERKLMYSYYEEAAGWLTKGHQSFGRSGSYVIQKDDGEFHWVLLQDDQSPMLPVDDIQGIYGSTATKQKQAQHASTTIIAYRLLSLWDTFAKAAFCYWLLWFLLVVAAGFAPISTVAVSILGLACCAMAVGGAIWKICKPDQLSSQIALVEETAELEWDKRLAIIQRMQEKMMEILNRVLDDQAIPTDVLQLATPPPSIWPFQCSPPGASLNNLTHDQIKHDFSTTGFRLYAIYIRSVLSGLTGSIFILSMMSAALMGIAFILLALIVPFLASGLSVLQTTLLVSTLAWISNFLTTNLVALMSTLAVGAAMGLLFAWRGSEKLKKERDALKQWYEKPDTRNTLEALDALERKNAEHYTKCHEMLSNLLQAGRLPKDLVALMKYLPVGPLSADERFLRQMAPKTIWTPVKKIGSRLMAGLAGGCSGSQVVRLIVLPLLTAGGTQLFLTLPGIGWIVGGLLVATLITGTIGALYYHWSQAHKRVMQIPGALDARLAIAQEEHRHLEAYITTLNQLTTPQQEDSGSQYASQSTASTGSSSASQPIEAADNNSNTPVDGIPLPELAVNSARPDSLQRSGAACHLR